jgi:hypothetical protein
MAVPTSFTSSFLAIQNSHDVNMFARHKAGGDTATVCINNAITVQALVDPEQDSQQFEFGSIPVRQTKIIHVVGTDMAPNVFGVDYDIGNPVSVNGDQRWQIQTVTESGDLIPGSEGQTTGAEVPSVPNMLDIVLIAAGNGE